MTLGLWKELFLAHFIIYSYLLATEESDHFRLRLLRSLVASLALPVMGVVVATCLLPATAADVVTSLLLGS